MALLGRPKRLNWRQIIAALLIGGAAIPLYLRGQALPAASTNATAEFDYWVLALSWSPQFCRDHPSRDQCKSDHPPGLIVHGLWPQFERGAPSFCHQVERVPRALTQRMLPLMPDVGLIDAQWRKHGSCSGLSMHDYFLNVERAWRNLSIPLAYRAPEAMLKRSPAQIEADFIAVNPKLNRDAIAMQCSGRYLREVRICLDQRFEPRACSSDVRDQCRAKIVHIRPPRSR